MLYTIFSSFVNQTYRGQPQQTSSIVSGSNVDAFFIYSIIEKGIYLLPGIGKL